MQALKKMRQATAEFQAQALAEAREMVRTRHELMLEDIALWFVGATELLLPVCCRAEAWRGKGEAVLL